MWYSIFIGSPLLGKTTDWVGRLDNQSDAIDEAASMKLKDEEYVKARRLAEEALVDARLAESKANSEIARRDAAELQKTIESLRAEAQRGSSR